MVHPTVLEYGNIDPIGTQVLLGMGLDRVVNQIYGIDDIRLLYENDIRLQASFNGKLLYKQTQI